MSRMSILRASVFSLMLNIACTACLLAQSPGSPEVNVIHVDIDGLHSDRGQVRCALFSSAADFPKKADKALAHATSEISGGRATCQFPSVPSGFPVKG